MNNRLLKVSSGLILGFSILLNACGGSPTTPQQYPQQGYGYPNQYPQQQYGQQFYPQQAANPAMINNQQIIPQNTPMPANAPVQALNNNQSAQPAVQQAALNAPQPQSSTATSLAQKIMLKSKAFYDQTNNYQATITMFTKRNERTSPKSTPIAKGKFEYTFQKPRMEAFKVLEHNISVAIDARIVWKGDDKMRVKAAGALGLLPMELSLYDTKLTTNRNWNFGQLDHIAILERALSPKAKLTVAGKTSVNGKPAYMIKVEGTGLDEEITEENIAVDAQNFSIMGDSIYAGKDLVFQLKIDLQGTNVSIPPGTFEI